MASEVTENNLSSDSSSEDESGEQEELRSHVGFGARKRPHQEDAPKTEVKKRKGPQYSDFAKKYMQSYGHTEGKGLGKYGEGITAPVKASTQSGRRGLGSGKTGDFDEDFDLEWDEEEEVSVREPLDWISCTQDAPTAGEVEYWKESTWVSSKKKLVIDDESQFCDHELLQVLLKQKSKFDNLSGAQMRHGRTRSNPFETIKGGIFLNRAAMKMANMDYLCDFMFTSPKDKENKPLVDSSKLLYFADICAGPGGFSEYVLWRRKWNTKGFGFTLRGENDFKLEDFYAGSPEFFEPHYGADGSGNIMSGRNLKAFREFVFDNTDNQGVHFVMADGGFSVEGQENIQEILTKQLLLCQFLCALSILREGGHFVCKTFDLFTPFSVGLVYLLYRVFDSIAILKCNTSRPANSERYVIGRGLKPGHIPVHDLMFDLNETLNEIAVKQLDIYEILPIEVLKGNSEFYECVVEQNDRQAKMQIKALKKIQAFCRNRNLVEPLQADLRMKSLQLWGIPEKSRSAPKVPEPLTKLRSLCKDEGPEVFEGSSIPLNHDTLKKFTSIFDYRCIVSAGERFLVLGVGRTHVYQWNGRRNAHWRKPENCHLNLPADTLLEVEMLDELKGEGSGQRKIKSYHILDALWLAGEDVRSLHYTERMQKAELFVKALHKPTRTDFSPLRVKEVFRMEQFHEIFDRLQMKRSKQFGGRPRLSYVMLSEDRHFIPTGVHFIRTINEPWTMVWSRSHRRKYFFNTSDNTSMFDCPPGSVAPYSSSATTRLHWAWDEGVQIHPSYPPQEPDKVSKDEILQHVAKQIPG